MGTFEALSKYFKKPLYNIAEDLGYDYSNILILKNEERLLKTQFPKVYSNLLSCNHNKDKRTFMAYAQDLVASWIFEDYLILYLQNFGLNIERSGTDKYRKVLPNSKISSASDLKIRINNKQIYAEIMCDYTGFWTSNKKVDLRDDKYNRLKREHAVFLGFDIINKKYLLIDFAQPIEALYISSHYPYGGKPVYSINLKNNHPLFKIDIEEIVQKIIFIMRKR